MKGLTPLNKLFLSFWFFRPGFHYSNFWIRILDKATTHCFELERSHLSVEYAIKKHDATCPFNKELKIRLALTWTKNYQNLVISY